MHYWTKERTERILKEYSDKGPTLLAEELGCSVIAVKVKASRLGVQCVQPKRIVAKRNEAVNTSYFSEWGSNMAYVLGYIWADGSVNSAYNKLTLYASVVDEELVKRIRLDMKSTHRLAYVPARSNKSSHSGPAVSCQICSTILVSRLKELGVLNRKSYRNIPFPPVPKTYTADFVRGYFDGDGTAAQSKWGPRIGFAGSYQFIKDLTQILVETLEVRPSKVCKTGSIFQVSWAFRKDVATLATWMYHGAKLYGERKRAILEAYIC